MGSFHLITLVMVIKNLNPTNEIGASAWHISDQEFSLLLDAGLHPKLDGRESMPLLDEIEHDHLDAIILSHCHYDHVASLPLVIKKFPQARVLMSELSTHIIERVLHNSANVMKRQRDEMGILDYPLYDNKYVEEVSSVFEGLEYGDIHKCNYFDLGNKGAPHPEIKLYDAGHTLGASGIHITTNGRRIFYTGDCSFQDQLVLKGAQFSDVEADIVIMETTRGAHDASKTQNRAREIRKLKEAIIEVSQRRGTVLIPSFALGRTQEMLAMLAGMISEGQIPNQPIFIGGLGRIFSEIYDGLARKTQRHLPELRLTKDLNLVVQKPDEINTLKFNKPKIFVATAGMMNENTTAHDLAIRLCSDPIHGIFFVGYADQSTPGGRLKQSELSKPFYFSSRAPDLERECEMRSFDITGHANREELLEWLIGRKPSHVVLAHGELDSREWFTDKIKHNNVSIQIHNPGPGEVVNIP